MHPIKLALASALTGAIALGGVYVATSWSVQARLETAARAVSNRAAKQDRLPIMRTAPLSADPACPDQEYPEHGGLTS